MTGMRLYLSIYISELGKQGKKNPPEQERTNKLQSYLITVWYVMNFLRG